ncbi:pilus assembly PilX family protein [Porticoccus sp. GXU_MW_L64]
MNLPTKQGGAALIVCLVVLLVMSVIGVTSVSNSTIQQRMAFNLQQQQLAENAAEHALRAAESYIADTITSRPALQTFSQDGNRGRNFFMLVLEGTQRDNPAAIWDFSDVSLWNTGSGIAVPGLTDDVTSQDPRYVIEYVGWSEESALGDNESGNSRQIRVASQQNRPVNFRYRFRITAIGWGVDPNAYSILQTTYQTIRITDSNG